MLWAQGWGALPPDKEGLLLVPIPAMILLVGLDRTFGANFPRRVEREPSLTNCPFATSTAAACPLNHCGGPKTSCNQESIYGN